jgi:superfamily I DNA/RNA helicase
MADEAARLAASARGAMVAPAGCGKTHTIAEAVAKHAQGRQLVLTHTHAGVDALRTKLRVLGAAPNSYEVETIAGWSLRLAACFPRTSAIPSEQPKSQDEYDAVYRGAVALLRMRPHQEVLRATYAGVFVDEYQDCTDEQHQLVLSLRALMPTRVVGDPLQGIFGFGSNRIVRWREQVDPEFESLLGPSLPRRWEGANEELGAWLVTVRRAL